MPAFLRWIVLGLVILPFAELAVFVAVAMQIGLAMAVAATLAASLAGLVLLKIAGRSRLVQLRVVMADTRVSAGELSGRGLFTALAGILLVIPGFLTDIAALLLLTPPVQQALAAAVGRALRPQASDGVVDLAPGDWNRVDERRPSRDLPAK